MSQQSTVADKAKALILARGGLIRTREAISLGIHPRTLYSLRDSGELEELSRGIYQLKGWKQLEYPDLITVALRVPNGVLCLVSALSFHEMTTEGRDRRQRHGDGEALETSTPANTRRTWATR